MKIRIIGCNKNSLHGLKLALHELILYSTSYIYLRVLATNSLSLCMHKYFVYLRTIYLLGRACAPSRQPKKKDEALRHMIYVFECQLYREH